MSDDSSELKIAENEQMFKEPNQKVVSNFRNLEKTAREDSQLEFIPDLNIPIRFFCECADENCRKRVELKISEYEQLHQNSSQFVILPGHNVPSAERIVREGELYFVVEKNKTPPKNPKKLNKTDIDNTGK